MTTVEHKVATRHAAAAQRAAGKPSWKETIRLGGLFRSEHLSFEEKRDMFIRAVRRSRWFRAEAEGSELHLMIEEAADAETMDDLRIVLDSVYDEADLARVWIAA